MSTSSKVCEKCLNGGVKFASTPLAECDSCTAPPVTETIIFDDTGVDLRNTGWGIDTYIIGSGHDGVPLNRDEARAVIAHMQSWLDKTTATQESESIAPVKYKSTLHETGESRILTIVRVDGDEKYWCDSLKMDSPYAVECTTLTGDFHGLYDIDGDVICDRAHGTWEPVDASKVPADVIVTVEKSWNASHFTLVAIKAT